MPNITGSEIARTRSRVGVTSRVGTPAEREEARRAHAEAMLAEYIKRVIADAPPLTDEQLSRIARILFRGGVSR